MSSQSQSQYVTGQIFMYGPNGLPLEQINNSSGVVSYLHHDQAGSTRLITGSTGTVTGKCTYSAYGTPTCEGTATTPLGYDAQYTSQDTGLIYMRAREYDPATAQFLTVDPWVGLTGEPYSYASDNPLTWADPTGRCGVVCIGGIVLGGVAVATGVGEVVGAAIVIGDATVSLGTVSAATGLAGAGWVKAIGLTLGGIGGLGDAAGALAGSNPESNSTQGGCG